MSGRISVKVPVGAAGSRADRFMADASGLSRSYVQRLIAEGRLTDAGRVLRSRDPVVPGARLELEVPEPQAESLEAEALPLTVIYRDDAIVVVDKPAGMVTHPGPGHRTGTLVNALLALEGGEGRLGSIAGRLRPGIVHRLDRDTSGLLVVARHDAAQIALQTQLKARRVRKTYQALVAGAPAAQAGRIEASIGRDPRHRCRMAVVADGREAVTAYRVRERFDGWTLLEVDLVTGRTHQIRVHLASIACPVAGDPVYSTGRARRGPAGLERMFLHAWRIELVSPADGRLVRAEAPLPTDLQAVLDRLEAAGSTGSGLVTAGGGEGR